MSSITIYFGKTEITDSDTSWTYEPETDPNRRAFVKVRADALAGGVDFASVVRVVVDGEPQFTGLVFNASFTAGIAELELRTDSQRLSEQRTSGMVVGPGTPVQDLLWSFMRQGGIDADRIMIEGISLTLRNFEVTLPIHGLNVDSRLVLAGVIYRSRSAYESLVRDLATPESSDLINSFLNASAFATTTVEASSLDDAERVGLEKIRVACAWLFLGGRYTYSSRPWGGACSYDRGQSALAEISVGTFVHVKGIQSQHRWLRGLTTTFERPDLSIQYVGNHAPLSPSAPDDARLNRAAIVWHNATLSLDAFEKVSALWQTIELYVSSRPTSTTTPMFDEAALAIIKRARKTDFKEFSADQKQRLADVLGRINDPPLMLRFRRALEFDRIPVSDAEMEIIANSRKLRNELEHGRIASAIEVGHVDACLALIGRVLAHLAERAPGFG